MTPTGASPDVEREAIARIVDPGGFSGEGDHTWVARQPRRDKAFVKADAILSALSSDRRVDLGERDAAFLDEASRYFEKRPTGGEDMAFWSNAANAANCRRIASAIRSLPPSEPSNA